MPKSPDNWAPWWRMDKLANLSYPAHIRYRRGSNWGVELKYRGRKVRLEGDADKQLWEHEDYKESFARLFPSDLDELAE